MIRYDQKLPGTITKAPGSVFLCNRKFRGIPCYIKRHKDAHSREDVDCRKRPCEARECAKVHSLFKVRQKTKVKTEKIIEKITFISTWIYWK